MLVHEYNYKDYLVEIHQHPIYHDFEFVVKKDNKVVVVNTQFYRYSYDAEKDAELEINLI